MAFWKKSEDSWDIDPDERRLASEPAEKAPGLLLSLIHISEPTRPY